MTNLDPIAMYRDAHILHHGLLDTVMERIEIARRILEDAELVIDARQNPDTPDEEQRGGLSFPQPGPGDGT
jgi:hypothetical protein